MIARQRAIVSAIATEMFASEVHELADAVLHHGTLGFLAHRGLVIVPDTMIAESADELRSFLDLDEIHPGVGLPRDDGRVVFVLLATSDRTGRVSGG
jgi:hypothetical protein